MSAARRLIDLSEGIASSGGASRSDALRILPLARELAEARGELAGYPTTRFFADWALHSQLDRASAQALLDRVAKVVRDNWSGDVGNIVIGISQLLSPYLLRDELERLFCSANVPLLVLRLPEPWTTFARWILQDLLEKPVIGSAFPDSEKEAGWGTTPRELRLTADSMPGSPIQWRVAIGPRVQLVGDLKRVDP